LEVPPAASFAIYIIPHLLRVFNASELAAERAAYAAIPNQRERKQTMIHTMITAISTNLPMPHILLGAITGLLIAASIFLWLKHSSRCGAIMLLALAIIEDLQGARYSVLKVEGKEKRKKNRSPFHHQHLAAGGLQETALFAKGDHEDSPGAL
jgi:hypothetical protein